MKPKLSTEKLNVAPKADAKPKLNAPDPANFTLGIMQAHVEKPGQKTKKRGGMQDAAVHDDAHRIEPVHLEAEMGRKLSGRKSTGKGLRGALQSYLVDEQKTKQRAQAAENARDAATNKEQAMKSGTLKKSKPKPASSAAGRPKAFLPFNKDETLLLVGEGDFSYALSIVKNGYVEPPNLIATSYDSEQQLRQKYPTAESNIQQLKDMQVKVLHEIDATDLVHTLKAQKHRLLAARLNHIMFNFPHTGRGIKDTNRNIRENQILVQGYFESAKALLQVVNKKFSDTSGYFGQEARETILMTLFEGEPYISWGVKALARAAGYQVERSALLEWSAFPGYCHRRTNGMGTTTKTALTRPARVYIFTKFVPNSHQTTEAVDSDSD